MHQIKVSLKCDLQRRSRKIFQNKSLNFLVLHK
jgi:hypothetical protein